MTQFNIIGTFLGCSGYDRHTRGLINALHKVSKVRLSCGLIQGWERIVNDKELEMMKTKPTEDEINLIITSPVHWRTYATAKQNWVYCVWEGDKVPKFFIEEMCNPEIEYILVPSTHTRDAIVRTLHETPTIFGDMIPNELNDIIIHKIKLVPHGVDTNLFYPKEKPKRLTFLCVKGFRNLEDRGGMQYCLKAYLEEFTDKEDVELKLLINPAYGIPNLDQMIRALTNKKNNLPSLIIDTNAYKYEDMVNIYNSANVLIMPSRAEAYGLPGIEAMACGLPVTTTNFGGQTDYVNSDNGWLVGGELIEVKHEIQYEGIKWLTPDIIELRKILREIYENPEKARQKGCNGLKTALLNTWGESANKLMKLV